MNSIYIRLISWSIATLVFQGVMAQEPQSFRLQDFQLLGPVKKCVVRANYGEETFEFDRQGRLLKTITQYNENDYDITYYKFRDSLLIERRDEVYREGTFDPQTSMAHIYQRDTLVNRRTELTVSYDRSFTEQLDRYYDTLGRLTRSLRSDASGTDETLVTYTSYKNETTATYRLNGNLLKSIRKSRKTEKGTPLQIVLTKEYREGEPQAAVEVVRNMEGQIQEEKRFSYDTLQKAFVPYESRIWKYDPLGFPIQQILRPLERKDAGEETAREFIYQMDGAEPPNWVRQVTVPDNTMVVRSIEYYKPEESQSKPNIPRK